MRVEVTLAGARAHTARPWMGRNAIHRLGEVLAAGRRPTSRAGRCSTAASTARRCRRWRVEGGVAGNVVPDRATSTLNHRFAPDRTPDRGRGRTCAALLAPALDEDDTFEVVDVAGGAPPSLDHPLLAALIGRNQLPVAAKLGWTDVARFAAHGIPSANFGPGDPTLAHMADERVERAPVSGASTCSTTCCAPGRRRRARAPPGSARHRRRAASPHGAGRRGAVVGSHRPGLRRIAADPRPRLPEAAGDRRSCPTTSR